jgi:DNA-binding CsgD family transcriptional regulator
VETLSALGLPAAVVNRRLKVRHLNAALAGLEPLVSITAHDRLIIGAPAVENLLAQAVEHVGGSHGGSVRSIPIPATFDRPALVLHILPITRQANDIFAGSDAMIVATPAVAREGLDVSVLVGCYDLTSAEARVAAAVAAGRTIDEIADASAVSRETVRTHLKRVLSKTGTTRQGELAAMLGPLSAIQPAV